MRENINNGVITVVIAMLPIALIASIISGINEGFGEAILALFMWGFWVVVVSILSALILGAPIFLILNYLKINNWITIILSGILIGIVVGNWLFPYGSKIHISLFFSVVGAYGSIAFKYGAEKANANKSLKRD